MSYIETMSDREQARNWGYADQERAWILSDRDVWHRNPFYAGPAMPHPEDDVEDIEAWREAEINRLEQPRIGADAWWTDAKLDDFPF